MLYFINLSETYLEVVLGPHAKKHRNKIYSSISANTVPKLFMFPLYIYSVEYFLFCNMFIFCICAEIRATMLPDPLLKEGVLM